LAGTGAPGAPHVPPELEQQIEDALEVLEKRADGHLPLPARRAVRAHFGDTDERGAGRRRLFDLYRRCVERVLAVWTSERAGDDRPARMIQLAEGVMFGQLDEQDVKPEYDEFAVDLDDRNQELGPRVFASGRAAADLVWSAATADYGDEIPAGADDEDLDPDMMSPDYFASLAEASFFGEPDEDPEARRRFWRWYLDEAVPAAYRSVDG